MPSIKKLCKYQQLWTAFYKENDIPEEIDFSKILKKYNIKKCYYAHLHGESHKDALEGVYDDIEFKLISSDYLNFDLLKI